VQDLGAVLSGLAVGGPSISGRATAPRCCCLLALRRIAGSVTVYSAPPLKLQQNGWLGNYCPWRQYIAFALVGRAGPCSAGSPGTQALAPPGYRPGRARHCCGQRFKSVERRPGRWAKSRAGGVRHERGQLDQAGMIEICSSWRLVAVLDRHWPELRRGASWCC